MTFYYYNEVEGEKIKNKVEIDEEKLKEIYQIFFERYSNKRDIKFLYPEAIHIIGTKDIIIKNYNIKKLNKEYEISYTMYDYPLICQIIDGLLCKETFDENYQKLQNLLLSTKQNEIEKVRRKLDMEIRTNSIFLEMPEYDCKSSLERMAQYIREIKRICEYDHTNAQNAKIVSETIKVEKIKKENYKKIYVKESIKKKNV